AGQIAVLSRTVLARILRLDRRTGISAKEDLTAPPQTCRKDTTGLRIDDTKLIVLDFEVEIFRAEHRDIAHERRGGYGPDT
ncbi:MAG: hypothetical protein ACREYE_23030, partial [Gammaproteobacteria bacterium]